MEEHMIPVGNTNDHAFTGLVFSGEAAAVADAWAELAVAGHPRFSKGRPLI
jgi:hypothetical protein